MTKAERKLIKYLLSNGADCCCKCVHDKDNRCCLIDPASGKLDVDRDVDEDRCIDGMIEYFESKE